MSDIHPHWHSTGADQTAARPQGAKIRVDAEGGVPRGLVAASRLPAAITGILVVIGIGAAALGQWGGWWTAQLGDGTQELPPDAVLIHVDTGGLVPVQATAKPGQQIIRINDQRVPQIFKSETLKDASGSNLYTAPIFTRSTYTFTIRADEPDGEHQYVSVTADQFKGSIVIQSDTHPAAPPEPPAAEPPPEHKQGFGGPLDGIPLPSGEGRLNPTESRSSAAAISSAAAPVPVPATQQNPVTPPPAASPTPSPYAASTQGFDNVVPVNPYTVSSNDRRSASDFLKQQTSSVPGKTLHSAAPRQPESGPALWVVCALSLGVLGWVTRKQMVAYRR